MALLITRRPTSSFVECLSIHPHKLISSKPSSITTIATKAIARSRRSNIRNNSSYSISSRISSSSRRVRPLFHSNRRGNNEEDATIDNLSTNQQQQFIYDESECETNSDSTNESNDDDDVEQKESISTSTTTSEEEDVICRIAASSDGKLERAFCQSPLLPKIHAIYHASTHFNKNNNRRSLDRKSVV